jgi:hypothetical protein
MDIKPSDGPELARMEPDIDKKFLNDLLSGTKMPCIERISEGTLSTASKPQLIYIFGTISCEDRYQD